MASLGSSVSEFIFMCLRFLFAVWRGQTLTWDLMGKQGVFHTWRVSLCYATISPGLSRSWNDRIKQLVSATDNRNERRPRIIHQSVGATHRWANTDRCAFVPTVGQRIGTFHSFESFWFICLRDFIGGGGYSPQMWKFLSFSIRIMKLNWNFVCYRGTCLRVSASGKDWS